MTVNSSARERAIASSLLDKAWLGDGGALFVKPEALGDLAGEFSSPEIALKFVVKHNMVAAGATLESERLPLRRDIVERIADHGFSLKHPERVEFSDPETHIALKLLAAKGGVMTGDSIDHMSFSITETALNAIDPDGVGRKNDWVREVHDPHVRSSLQGTSHVERKKLVQLVGISHDAAAGHNVPYEAPAKSREPRAHARANASSAAPAGRIQ